MRAQRRPDMHAATADSSCRLRELPGHGPCRTRTSASVATNMPPARMAPADNVPSIRSRSASVGASAPRDAGVDAARPPRRPVERRPRMRAKSSTSRDLASSVLVLGWRSGARSEHHPGSRPLPRSRTSLDALSSGWRGFSGGVTGLTPPLTVVNVSVNGLPAPPRRERKGRISTGALEIRHP